jgi:hypothetical protein
MNWESYIMHVKWFTDRESIPLQMSEVLTPAFLFWLGVTIGGLLVSAFFNTRILQVGFVQNIDRSLAQLKPYTVHILRVGLGIGILLQLVEDAYLAPEFKTDANWLIIVSVIALVGLLLKRTLFVSGLALLVLFIQATLEYGWFHTLDYLFYLGIIYYLMVYESRWKDSAIPVLYALTGLSLAWVGMEKLTMPDLAYDIIREFQVPVFGFSVEHFVLISAFIELGLAWTFMVGILNRFVSIVVTLVFIATTTVFGYTEVVGHTIIHTLLIMFIIQGGGAFRTPFEFHRTPFLRYLFVVVNFGILLFGMMWIYIAMGAHYTA